MATKSLIFIILYGIALTIPWDHASIKRTSSRMNIEWKHHVSFIRFDISAPTKGWVAIGFNERNQLKDSYLIMGRVKSNHVEIKEFKTLAAGNYKTISELGGKPMLFDLYGEERNDTTYSSFSVPTRLSGEFQKDLSKGNSYFMIKAFSISEDFQHHSIYRTQKKVTL